MKTERLDMSEAAERVDEAENASEITKPGYPVLIPQPGGRGALLSGGIPGRPNPNGGVPKSKIRENYRRLLDRHGAKQLEEWLEHPELLSTADKMRLYEMLNKFGIGLETEVKIENTQVFVVVGQVAARFMDEETYRSFRSELEMALQQLSGA